MVVYYYESLIKSERKYQNLIEALNEGIWVIDKNGYTTYVNPRMAVMLGYTAEEMEGMHFFEFMDEKGVRELKPCKTGTYLGKYKWKKSRSQNHFGLAVH